MLHTQSYRYRYGYLLLEVLFALAIVTLFQIFLNRSEALSGRFRQENAILEEINQFWGRILILNVPKIAKINQMLQEELEKKDLKIAHCRGKCWENFLSERIPGLLQCEITWRSSEISQNCWFCNGKQIMGRCCSYLTRLES